jgi:hypothetical protein
MKFDEHGQVLWTPRLLYDLAKQDPRRLVNRYLMTGTPCVWERNKCRGDLHGGGLA